MNLSPKVIKIDNFCIPLHHVNINAVSSITSLAYEPLTGSPYSSVRVGYDTKYRLIFEEHEDKITLLLIELSEHYGDH